MRRTSRREFLVISAAALGAGSAPLARGLQVGPFRVCCLRVDGLVTPLGLESVRPRLSWQLSSGRRGFKQRKFRVQVSSDPGMLLSGVGDLWDSGLVNGEQTFDVVYQGRAPASRQRCWWRVAAHNEEGQLELSSISWWEMGLLDSSDWQAHWVAAETRRRHADRAGGLHWIWSAGAPATDAPQAFRFRFSSELQPVAATLLIVARDALEGVWLNGAAVNRHLFKRGVVNNARMESMELDVREGINILAVQAALRPKAWPATPAGALAAVLRLEFADGSTRRLTTNSDWLANSAPSEGWQRIESDDGWTKAVEASSKPLFDPWLSEPAICLRSSFAVATGVRRARLYITALGAYEARLNGQKIGDGYLAPENTDFTRRVLYRTFDVTGLLVVGKNALCATVGDGWYGSTGLFGGRFNFGAAPNRLLAQLEIEFEDGRHSVLGTAPEWRIAPSAIRAAEIYDGEIFDARAEQVGWDRAQFDDDSWVSAETAPPPPSRLVSHVSPPVRIFATLLPKSVFRYGDVHVVDFGQNFAGWCRLRATAPAGTTVMLRFAEILNHDGTVDTSNLRSAEARDIYIFRGDPAGESFRPHFTYHGFRYVEISGWPAELPANFIVAEAICSDLPLTGELRIADPLIEQIWRNARWSQRSNFVGIPTDCPQRDERLGWMGDAQVFWDAAGFNMDVAAFTRRFMGDVRDGQSTEGAFAEFNPQSSDAHMKGAPGWADAGILLPWEVWWRYGDTAIIDENWEAMARYAQHVALENPDFIWRNARGTDYGDWLALDAREPGDPTTPKDLVATAFWASVTAKLSEMAAATGRHAEALKYGDRHRDIVAAFGKTFVGPDGTVGNGSQTGYVLALRFGLVAAELREAAARRLCDDIHRRVTVLSTGFLGTPHVLDVLADAGEVALVYDLLDRTEYPSWGYMVSHGATTMWERWNSDTGDVAMNSYNHYAFGAIVGFLYRRIAGIEATQPGFRRARIRPLVNGRLNEAGATYDSSCGRFRTDWAKNPDGSFDLALTVPANSSAEVHLPAGRSGLYREGRLPVQRSRDVRILTRTTAGIVLEVGSGEYNFRTT
jgi:alpha-L-rhamnosidase